MGRLLAQLFEITAAFDMRLRPELVLLQKTMATVEGVARRIDPDNDIWAAARPVVERWIQRELSPAAQARDLLAQGRRALNGLARWAENPAPPTSTVVVQRHSAAASAALIVSALALAAACMALGVVLSLLLI